MYALLLVALLGAGQDPTRPATGAGTSDRDRGRDAAGHATLDGTWTVVAYERNGSPVNGATSHTATIRGNTLSFSTGGTGTGTGTDRTATGAGAGTDATAFGTFRVDFGPRNTVRVTEMGAAGTGTDTTRPGAGAATDRAAAGARSGVYVMSRDYIAIMVQDDRTGAGTGAGASAGVGPEMRSYMTVLLRRSDAGGTGERR